MAPPRWFYADSPTDIERMIEEENARNGHIGTIESYFVVSKGGGPIVRKSTIGFDDAEQQVRQLKPYDELEYRVAVSYRPK